jgi:hypothetical protein
MKNDELKIENGIPIPHSGRDKGYSAKIRALKVGESVLLPTRIQSATTICYQTGLPRDSFTRRAEKDGTRVWRIKMSVESAERDRLLKENERLRKALEDAANALHNLSQPDNQSKAYISARSALNEKD